MEKDEFKVLDKKLDHVIEYMDKRFDEAEKRFDKIDKRFESVDKRFIGMLNYMEKRFDDVDKKFTENQISHDRTLSNIDYLTGMVQKLDQERLFGIERSNRIEKDVLKIKRHLKLSQ
jgi:phage shock protein A